MIESHERTFQGLRTEIAVRSWVEPGEEPRYVALLVHGYGEHIGRYGHVAAALVAHGAVVYGLDHMGHGKSGGDRVVIDDFADVVADVHALAQAVREEWPRLPVVMIGHSMGGMIAARYAQLHGDTLAALVLSGPAFGRFEVLEQLLELEEIPEIPIDPTTLSRDPAVGQAYAADPLVWHGPFKRPTLAAWVAMMRTITESGSLGDLPLLWIHGTDDQLVPIDGSRQGIEALRGTRFQQHLYQDAKHEVFNETNAEDVLADVTRFLDDALS